MGSVEVSEALDTDTLEAISCANEVVMSDILEDGARSTDDGLITWDGVGIMADESEDSDGPIEAGTVEARSPSWDDGEGVEAVLDTEEDSAESGSVGTGPTCEDEGPMMIDSKVGVDSAGGVVEVSSS